MNELSEEELRELAAQLRKPSGEFGREVGERMNQSNGQMNLYTIAAVNPQKGDKILEIGMGNGRFVKNIVNLDSDIHYTGCDYSSEMVEIAAEINENFIAKGQVQFIHANVGSMPFENESFDKIFTVNTFYFWEDHLQVAKELKRLLKPGGSLILAVRPKSILVTYPVVKYDFAIFSNEEIVDLLQKAGFDIVDVTEIKEPNLRNSNFLTEREALILSCSCSS